LPVSGRRVVALVSAALAALLFLVVDYLLIRAAVAEITLFHARSPSLGIPVWAYYAGVVACTPFVFAGVWRGARAELAGLRKAEGA
jgi:TRAP-type C4-dicarboxylate transport system permease small subunit